MPSNRAPLTALDPITSGPNPPSGGGGPGLIMAGSLVYAGGPNWADGTTNPATTVELQLDKIISDLADSSAPGGVGGDRVGIHTLTDVPSSISWNTTTLAGRVEQISYATHIAYGPGPAWIDATTNPATSVELQIDKIINDLGSTTALASGAGRIGIDPVSNFADGGGLSASDVRTAIDVIVARIADANITGGDGAGRIGAGTIGSFTSGTVRSQLNALDTGWGKLDRANTWTAAQTVEGASGDTNPVLITDVVPTNKKLLWQQRVASAPNRYYRMYLEKGADPVSDSRVCWTFNCSWNGSAWAGDDSGIVSYRWSVDGLGNQLLHNRRDSSTTWTDAQWDDTGSLNGRSGLAFFNTENSASEDANPPATSSQTNVLKAKNIVKAWGVVQVGNGGGSPSILNGFNISAVSYSTGYLVVNLAGDMADGNYAVIPSIRGVPGDTILMTANHVAGSFQIRAWDISAPGFADLGTGTFLTEQITFVVLGEQSS